MPGVATRAGLVMLALAMVGTACSGDGDGKRRAGGAKSSLSRATSQGTVPVEGAKPGVVKVVAAGDIAASPNGGRGTARLIAKAQPDVVLTLGDNAYQAGTIEQYRRNYDPTWGKFKGITRPVPGNHEYRTSGAAGYFRYFRNQVSRPYYAFNAGSWRLYALNCEIRCGKGSKQLRWLERDLANHRGRPTLAYLHRPRFTCSKHSPFGGLRPMWAALQSRRGRLVLSAHNHVYERFVKLDANGRRSGDGMRQFVVGTGGKKLYGIGSKCPNRRSAGDKQDGILVLQLRADSYSWVFRTTDGRVRDRGTGKA